MNKKEKTNILVKNDEIRVVILSVLLVIYFGIVNIGDEILNFVPQTEDFKLLGITIKILGTTSIIVIPLTLGYILTLGIKYSNFINNFYLKLNEQLYNWTIYLYFILYYFTLLTAIISFLKVKEIFNTTILTILFIIGILIFFSQFLIKKDN